LQHGTSRDGRVDVVVLVARRGLHVRRWVLRRPLVRGEVLLRSYEAFLEDWIAVSRIALLKAPRDRRKGGEDVHERHGRIGYADCVV
jgi:hypothetical protein